MKLANLRAVVRLTSSLLPLLAAAAGAGAAAGAAAGAVDANRFAYLETADPFYVSHTFPKIINPQWLGETNVDAVVVLGIDDLRNNAEHFETFLRPLLNRLKQIDGRAPVSIFTVQQTNSPLVQQWLKEGVNLEAHSRDHPCPLLNSGDLPKARRTYEQCVDALSAIPAARPVAFRVPCLDIWNTTSPRFYTEIFSQTTPAARFLTQSSSIQLAFSREDPSLPREMVVDEDGRDRFTKYFNQGITVFGHQDYQYGIHVLNYPFPIVVNRLCWEIPTLVSDHTASEYISRYGRRFLQDWETAVDATALKKGLVAFCFHPWGRTLPHEMPMLVDRLVAKHGPRVKFLNFAEVQERFDRNLLAGQPLRAPNGQDNGIRLLDVNNDGYLDVVSGNEHRRQTRVWSPTRQRWLTTPFPVSIVQVDERGDRHDAGVHFGVWDNQAQASLLVANERESGVWHFSDGAWRRDPDGLRGLELSGGFSTARAGRDSGVRLRDIDGDGRCEAIVSNDRQQAVFSWDPVARSWRRLGFALPAGSRIVDAEGRESGLRFVDLNGDGRLDVLYSDASVYLADLFSTLEEGWSRPILAGRHDEGFAFPQLASRGTNSGAWLNGGRLWMNNEFTDRLPNHTVSVRLDELAGFARAQTNLQHITRWLVLGPFPNEKENGREKGFATDFGPETTPGRINPGVRLPGVGGREVGWVPAEATAGKRFPLFDLPKFCREHNFRSNDVVVYLSATLESAVAQDARLLFGSEDAVKVWLNGAAVHSKFIRRQAEFGQDKVDVRLSPGRNLLLVKLELSGTGGALMAAVVPERKLNLDAPIVALEGK